MVRILCNLPLECFDERANLRNVELVTYGPPDRMTVGGKHFPFDVAFDPSRGSIEELLAALPAGFSPDLVLIWWPDQEPLPRDLQHCPVPVVGLVSDYNLSLPNITHLQPFFDVLLCDRAGVPLFERLGYPDVRYFCQFSFKRQFHRMHPEVNRDLDVGFAGNLNPIVQRDRSAWLHRVKALRQRSISVEVAQHLDGESYGRMLARSRIGFNRSIRGEMNPRGFEVPACGSVLLMERENLEVHEFFEPGEECVLYGQDDFESIVEQLLADDARRQRIATAGHARVQEHSLGKRMPLMLELLAEKGPGRRIVDDTAAALGRAEAMMLTWADGEASLAAAIDACSRAPDNARALNALALANLRCNGHTAVTQTLKLLQRALAADPAYVPAARNLALVLGCSNRADLAAKVDEHAAEQAASTANLESLCGPVLPLDYCSPTVAWSLNLQATIRRSRAPQPSATTSA